MRDRAGYTPPEAVDALVDALRFADNSGNAFDDSNMRAAHLAALGHVRVQSPEVCAVPAASIPSTSARGRQHRMKQDLKQRGRVLAS